MSKLDATIKDYQGVISGSTLRQRKQWQTGEQNGDLVADGLRAIIVADRHRRGEQPCLSDDLMR